MILELIKKDILIHGIPIIPPIDLNDMYIDYECNKTIKLIQPTNECFIQHQSCVHVAI